MSGALMTQTKVAEYPGKSRNKIRANTARKYMPFRTDPESGRLQGFHLGDKWRITREAANDYANGKAEP
jgi:hypothetical protein